MKLKDTHLEPCPLCGGRAEIEDIKRTADTFDATIVCILCGLRLEWSQPIVVGINFDGSKVYVPLDVNPFEAWNRRTHHDNRDHRQV